MIRIVKDVIIRQEVLAVDLKDLLKLYNDMVKQQKHQLAEELMGVNGWRLFSNLGIRWRGFLV